MYNIIAMTVEECNKNKLRVYKNRERSKSQRLSGHSSYCYEIMKRYSPARSDNCCSHYANRQEVLADDCSSAGPEGTTVVDRPGYFALLTVYRKLTRSAGNLNLFCFKNMKTIF